MEIATAPSPHSPLDADLVEIGGRWRLVDRHGDQWDLGTLDQVTIDALIAMRTGGAIDQELFDDLDLHGLISPPTKRLSVAVVGSRAAAGACARAVLDVPGSSLLVLDPRGLVMATHRQRRPLTGADDLRRDLLAAGADPARVVAQGHWSELGADAPVDLVVVAERQVEADRAITDHLVRTCLPHLVVTAHRDRATVGPFVLPGGSACVGCLDRHHSDRDPHWWAVVAALARRPARPADTTVAWIQATVASWLHTLARDDDCFGRGEVVQLQLGRGPASTVLWPPHPQCSCRG
ncbi:hypothetical protein [Aestuariimicrobium ganziense]|uniref:hypothetical protein n=1 Tax=Aestuariimicrobium ganziense TaxID=2773677 RepID=UPI0019426A82|nr:hypothetical protein [Aestuariimicrobium ganziense]